MFKFKARHQGQTHNILVRRDMSPREFTDALVFAMGLSNAQIFGFKDSTGNPLTQ